jgi:hypothetical protein
MENEKQQVKLGTFGMVDIVYPKSITILLDIVFEQSSTNGSRAKFGRLAAAAIGVLCPSIRSPRYSITDCDPLSYGATMQTYLLEHGVPLGDIISAGSKCLVLAGSKIPSNEEVEERENFSSDPEDHSND